MLEGADSIQTALMQVIRLILARQIEPRMAGRCSTLLQIASLNLKQTTLEPAHREEVVFDPSTVRDTLLDEDVWCEEDFKEEEEDEEPYQGDNAQTGSCPDLMAVAEPLPSLEEKLHFPQLRENIFQVVDEAARPRGVKTTRIPPQPVARATINAPEVGREVG